MRLGSADVSLDWDVQAGFSGRFARLGCPSWPHQHIWQLVLVVEHFGSLPCGLSSSNRMSQTSLDFRGRNRFSLNKGAQRSPFTLQTCVQPERGGLCGQPATSHTHVRCVPESGAKGLPPTLQGRKHQHQDVQFRYQRPGGNSEMRAGPPSHAVCRSTGAFDSESKSGSEESGSGCKILEGIQMICFCYFLIFLYV